MSSERWSGSTFPFTLSALYPFASQTGTGRETGPFGPPFGLTARPAARMGADKGKSDPTVLRYDDWR